MSITSPVVSLKGMSKRFPGVLACDGVDLDVYPGEIQGLLGENGAGKTTLMKVLYGLYQPDAGEILIDGRRSAIRSPKDAIRRGIGMVFQHFTLIPSLTVAENIALADPRSPRLIRHRAIAARIREMAGRYHLQVEPDTPVWRLSVAEQQRVEIIKVLYRRARVLILDEPSTLLSPREVDALLQTLHNLALAGYAVVLITHKLPEALKISHRITVLRRGRVVMRRAPAAMNPSDLARAMLGHDLPGPPERPAVPAGRLVLSLSEVSARHDGGQPALQRVSLGVRRGEIVGVAGVAGNGQQELAEVIAGLRRASAGTVRILDEDVTHFTPKQLIARGVSYIPQDRQGTGLVLRGSVRDNLLLKSYRSSPMARGPFLNRRMAEKEGHRILSMFRVTVPGLDTPVRALSGGNQQRLLLARELSSHPTLLIACSPTHGLDVGAVETTHRLLLEERQRGCAVLLFSEDLDELLGLSDQIAVLYKGRIVNHVRRAEVDATALGAMMSGVPSGLTTAAGEKPT
jgi:ABC-type uncharacterized transport system ATPase subunit